MAQSHPATYFWTETGWKPHSCRAFLSGVRKTGATLVKEERPDGKTAYRITAEAEADQCPA